MIHDDVHGLKNFTYIIHSGRLAFYVKLKNIFKFGIFDLFQV